MTTKVSLSRRWIGTVPLDRRGEPLPPATWPRRRPSCWIVRWFAPGADGKIRRLQRTFADRAAAEEFQASTQASFDRSPNTRHAPRPITITQFTAEFKEAGIGPQGKRLAPSTIIKTVQALKELAESVGPDTELRRIGTGDVDLFLAALRNRGLAKASVGSMVAVLKAAFNLAVGRRKYLTENPFSGTHIDTKVGPVRYVTRDELSAILTIIETRADPLWWRTLIVTAYTTALRLGELTHLTWRDIDFAAETVRVSAKKATDQTLAWEPKTKPSLREVPAPAGTMALLAELQQALPDRSTYVFLPTARFDLIR
ncbi:MAG: tyrosine-type recombinase/integrase, partial [Phycisphaerae bacterium]